MNHTDKEAILSAITVGPLTDSDPEAISELIRGMDSTGGEQRLRDKSADYYRWMYLQNPAGRAIVHSARHNGTLIGTFAIAPKLMQIDGHEVVIGKTMDMFTHPEYQGLGIIKRCTQAVFEEAAAAGMEAWYVTPSVNSYPIFKDKWGYREDFFPIYRARLIDPSRVIEAALRPAGIARVIAAVVRVGQRFRPGRSVSLPPEYAIEPLESFGEEVDHLWESVRGGFPVALVRNSTYLTWRYHDNPDSYEVLCVRKNGVLLGLIVLTTTVRRGVLVGEIVDYLFDVDDQRTFTLLVRAAVDRFTELNCALCQAWSIPGTRLDRKVRSAGLRLRRRTMKFLVSPSAPYPALYDGDAWLLTQGDGNDV